MNRLKSLFDTFDETFPKKTSIAMKLFNLHTNRPWPTKRPSYSPCRSPLLFLTLLFALLFFLSYYYLSPASLLSSVPSSSSSSSLQCPIAAPEKFLFYAPHSGFSNQLSEFRNAVLIARILDRTLVVPPILDHHAVALGSCPKFRVMDPGEIRVSVWNHAIELLRSGRYVSIADIIDLSSLASSSTVRFIDFRVFASKLCHLYLGSICDINLDPRWSSIDTLKQCGSILSNSSKANCVYAVNEDCRTTVWTYRDGNKDGSLDSFQPDEELKRKKKISYIRRRRDIYKSLGPGSEPGSASVLAFGSLFSGSYKGSESHIDIIKTSRDERIHNLVKKIEYLPFDPEITSAGRRFVRETIRAPFVCAQLRLLDGQFKNHWRTTFLGLKQKIESFEESAYPIHIFVMTDLPETNWTGTYLGDLAGDSRRFKLFSLKEMDELAIITARRIVSANRGLDFGGFLPKNIDKDSKVRSDCRPSNFNDVLLYIEETICSCASLGFVGTSGSTIAESIGLMRKFGVCSSSED